MPQPPSTLLRPCRGGLVRASLSTGSATPEAGDAPPVATHRGPDGAKGTVYTANDVPDTTSSATHSALRRTDTAGFALDTVVSGTGMTELVLRKAELVVRMAELVLRKAE